MKLKYSYHTLEKISLISATGVKASNIYVIVYRIIYVLSN